jgi:hypothetical protein
MSPKGVLQIKHIDDLLWRAQEYRHVLGKEAFDDVLEKAFPASLHAGPPPVATTLLHLQFAHVLTANFGHSLEQAFRSANPQLRTFDWADKAGLREFITRRLHHARQQCFLYLHGCRISHRDSHCDRVPSRNALVDAISRRSHPPSRVQGHDSDRAKCLAGLSRGRIPGGRCDRGLHACFGKEDRFTRAHQLLDEPGHVVPVIFCVKHRNSRRTVEE